MNFLADFGRDFDLGKNFNLNFLAEILIEEKNLSLNYLVEFGRVSDWEENLNFSPYEGGTGKLSNYTHRKIVKHPYGKIV